MNWIKGLYFWVMRWADTSYAFFALCLLAFTESIFFPIPPDVLLVAMSISSRDRSFVYASFCSVFSILGGFVGYLIGFLFWEYSRDFFFSYVPGFSFQSFDDISIFYDRYNFWIVFVVGFTPLPYKVISLSAGVFKIDIFLFLLASFISRSLRFFLLAFFIYFFGEKIRYFIERYFNLLTILFVLILIAFYFFYNFF